MKKLDSIARFRTALSIAGVCFVLGCSSPEEKAQSYYERGTKFISEGNYTKAGIEFKNALQLNKSFLPAWRGLLDVETRSSNSEALIPILRTIVELDPNNVDAKLRLGRLVLVGNALDQAFELANSAAELDPKNADILSFRATVLLKLNDRVGAVREAEAALEIDPNNADAVLVLAAERIARGEPDAALRTLDRNPAAHQNNIAIQLFKLKILDENGRAAEVEAILRRMIGVYPREIALRQALGSFFARQNRVDEAITEFRAIADANQSNVDLGINFIRYLQAKKGVPAAREELLKRINAGERTFQYQIALAGFDLTNGNEAQSIQLLEQLARNAKSPEERVLAQTRLAEANFRLKKFDAAEPVISDILSKDARNVDGLRLRAALRLERGQTDSAISDLRQALNEQPRSSGLMLMLATGYERSGSIELAEKQFADATRSSGFEPNTALEYVKFLRRRGNEERAEETLLDLARRWPTNIAVLTNLADVRLARQNWIGAQSIAERLQRLDRAVPADQVLAAALSGRGMFNESIQILQNLQQSTPDAVEPMVALVSTMVRAQQLDKAKGFLENIINRNPSNADALTLLGSIQVLQKQPENAVQSFQAAIAKQPNRQAAYLAFADFHIQSGKPGDAQQVLQAGLNQLPDNFALRFTLARALLMKNDNDAAISEFEQLFQQQPDSLIVANNLASLLADHRGDKASLERAYTVSAKLRKSPVPSFKDTLGWIYQLRGDTKAALPLLEEATAAIPQEPLVRYHLGMSYLADGQSSKAAEQFNKALELRPSNEVAEKIKAAQAKIPM
jgi:tetratricopeptide (TPR) repeat protein